MRFSEYAIEDLRHLLGIDVVHPGGREDFHSSHPGAFGIVPGKRAGSMD